MAPKKVVEWGLAASSVVVLVLFIAALFTDLFFHKRFPRLEAILNIQSPMLAPLLTVAIAAACATFVVFLLNATKGTLRLKALGIEFTGPSGPILLWVTCFVAVSVVVAAILAKVA
jgi:hypothetical protein